MLSAQQLAETAASAERTLKAAEQLQAVTVSVEDRSKELKAVKVKNSVLVDNVTEEVAAKVSSRIKDELETLATDLQADAHTQLQSMTSPEGAAE